MRRFAPLLVFAICCDAAPPTESPDVEILVGEGAFPRDGGVVAPVDGGAGEDAGGVTDAFGADASLDAEVGLDAASDPCLAPPELFLSPAEAEARALELDGRVVEIAGTASVGASVCQSGPCPDGTSCCNRCRAPLRLDGRLLLVPGPCTGTATVGCSGSACGPLVCAPPAFGAPVRAVGRLRALPEPGFEPWRILR